MLITPRNFKLVLLCMLALSAFTLGMAVHNFLIEAGVAACP